MEEKRTKNPKRIESMKRSHAKMSEEQKAEISAKRSKSMKKFWADYREMKAKIEQAESEL